MAGLKPCVSNGTTPKDGALPWHFLRLTRSARPGFEKCAVWPGSLIAPSKIIIDISMPGQNFWLRGTRILPGAAGLPRKGDLKSGCFVGWNYGQRGLSELLWTDPKGKPPRCYTKGLLKGTYDKDIMWFLTTPT
jgi:hypothetical protein